MSVNNRCHHSGAHIPWPWYFSMHATMERRREGGCMRYRQMWFWRSWLAVLTHPLLSISPRTACPPTQNLCCRVEDLSVVFFCHSRCRPVYYLTIPLFKNQSGGRMMQRVTSWPEPEWRCEVMGRTIILWRFAVQYYAAVRHRFVADFFPPNWKVDFSADCRFLLLPIYATCKLSAETKTTTTRCEWKRGRQ